MINQLAMVLSCKGGSPMFQFRFLFTCLWTLMAMVLAMPVQASTLDAFNARISQVRFFESAPFPDLTPFGERSYQHVFVQEEARFIWFELHVAHPSLGASPSIPITIRFLDQDGSTLIEGSAALDIEVGTLRTIDAFGTGWETPGNWSEGTYTLQVLDGNGEIAVSSFTILGQHATPTGFSEDAWITSFYVAYWDRIPDAGGHAYWKRLFHQGILTIPEIAENFALQPEAKAIYPYFNAPHAATDTQVNDFVRSVYRNLLGREVPVDDSGVRYWVGELRSGRTSPGLVIGDIIHAAMQDESADWQTILGKTMAADEMMRFEQAVWSVGAGEVVYVKGVSAGLLDYTPVSDAGQLAALGEKKQRVVSARMQVDVLINSLLHLDWASADYPTRLRLVQGTLDALDILQAESLELQGLAGNIQRTRSALRRNARGADQSIGDVYFEVNNIESVAQTLDSVAQVQRIYAMEMHELTNEIRLADDDPIASSVYKDFKRVSAGTTLAIAGGASMAASGCALVPLIGIPAMVVGGTLAIVSGTSLFATVLDGREPDQGVKQVMAHLDTQADVLSFMIGPKKFIKGKVKDGAKYALLDFMLSGTRVESRWDGVHIVEISEQGVAAEQRRLAAQVLPLAPGDYICADGSPLSVDSQHAFRGIHGWFTLLPEDRQAALRLLADHEDAPDIGNGDAPSNGNGQLPDTCFYSIPLTYYTDIHPTPVIDFNFCAASNFRYIPYDYEVRYPYGQAPVHYFKVRASPNDFYEGDVRAKWDIGPDTLNILGSWLARTRYNTFDFALAPQVEVNPFSVSSIRYYRIRFTLEDQPTRHFNFWFGLELTD
ncbi:MAG: DUF4214 domain-containing protein [Desulfovibrionales bacterium]|nr:MAG: DUF4214 domain-containing protein [Desulfovibrionales bacterium]